MSISLAIFVSTTSQIHVHKCVYNTYKCMDILMYIMLKSKLICLDFRKRLFHYGYADSSVWKYLSQKNQLSGR